MKRRSFLTAAALGATPLLAQEKRDWSGQNPVRYPDPDIVVIDPRFNKYKLGNTPIRRLGTGYLWAEGPAWSGVGKYLLFSDIPNNVQMRWTEESGAISTFRNPSGNSNGNTFDWEGRQISCEHGGRRVVRYEHDGTVTVLADEFDGKPFTFSGKEVPNSTVLAFGRPNTKGLLVNLIVLNAGIGDPGRSNGTDKDIELSISCWTEANTLLADSIKIDPVILLNIRKTGLFTFNKDVIVHFSEIKNIDNYHYLFSGTFSAKMIPPTAEDLKTMELMKKNGDLFGIKKGEDMEIMLNSMKKNNVLTEGYFKNVIASG